MTGAKTLSRLARLAGMQRDMAMQELARRAAARQATLAEIAGLDDELDVMRTAVDAIDPPAVLAGERFTMWGLKRRSALNMRLANETVAWLEFRDVLAHAHGRATAISKLETSAGLSAKKASEKRRDEMSG